MNELLSNLDWGEIAQACLDTLSMLGAALGFTVLFGLPLGYCCTSPGNANCWPTGRSTVPFRLWSTCCVRCRSSSC